MKSELTFQDTTIEADMTKVGLIAVHRSLDPAQAKKGYVLTHVPTLEVICWAPLKEIALKWQKILEGSGWDETTIRKLWDAI